MRIGTKVYEAVGQPPPASQGVKGGGRAGGAAGIPGGEVAAPKSAAGRANEVKVDVSDEAQRLAAASSLDVAKVEKLRSAIADGTFQVDSHAIANKLVENGG